MVAQSAQGLLSMLFDRPNSKLINIKFFRGTDDLITSDQLLTEAHSAVFQRLSGRAKMSETFPEDDVEPVDVRELVASL